MAGATIKEMRAQVEAQKKQVETVAGYLAALPEESRRALEEIAARMGYLCVEALAVGELSRKLAGVRAQRQREVTRQRFGDELLAKRSAEKILAVLTADDLCQWVVVDKMSNTVAGSLKHPISREGRITIDCRDRDELKDLTGAITIASVVARVLGYERPDPRMEG